MVDSDPPHYFLAHIAHVISGSKMENFIDWCHDWPVMFSADKPHIVNTGWSRITGAVGVDVISVVGKHAHVKIQFCYWLS